MLENLHGCRRRYNNLGTTLHPPDEILALEEMFICQLYQPGTGISQVKGLRWHMFITNQTESDRLPPTQGALYEAILRTHYQIIVWNNDKCVVLVCHSQMDSGGRKGRINGSPLWQKKHLLLKQSSNWSGATTVKRTDAQTIDVTGGNQAWVASTSVLTVIVMIPVKMLGKILIH